MNSRRHTLVEMEGSRVCPALGSAGGAAVLSRFDVVARRLCVCVRWGRKESFFYGI